MSKTLGNTTASRASENVKDLQVWGNGDAFKLICKAHSEKEGWMKSTKAMEIAGQGCLVQVTTQQGYNVAEGLAFVNGVTIKEQKDEEGNVVARYLENLHYGHELERRMIEFGNYLLSAEREASVYASSLPEETLRARLRSVSDADVRNWIEKNRAQDCCSLPPLS